MHSDANLHTWIHCYEWGATYEQTTIPSFYVWFSYKPLTGAIKIYYDNCGLYAINRRRVAFEY